VPLENVQNLGLLKTVSVCGSH